MSAEDKANIAEPIEDLELDAEDAAAVKGGLRFFEHKAQGDGAGGRGRDGGSFIVR